MLFARGGVATSILPLFASVAVEYQLLKRFARPKRVAKPPLAVEAELAYASASPSLPADVDHAAARVRLVLAALSQAEAVDVPRRVQEGLDELHEAAAGLESEGVLDAPRRLLACRRSRTRWPGSALAAGDRGHDPHLGRRRERRLQTALRPRVAAVHVDVHERPQRSRLVEHEVTDRQGAQRVAERPCLELETLLPSGLDREQRRQEDYGQSTASTERIGGSWLATSLHPPSRLAKTEPLCVPT